MKKSKTLLPPPINSLERIRVPKKQRFAVKDSELLKLHRTVFLNYCKSLEHDYQDILLLTKIFDAQIDAKNIRNYISVSAQNLYIGITRDCLHKYSANIC